MQYKESVLSFVERMRKQTTEDGIHFSMNLCLNIWMTPNEIATEIDSSRGCIMTLGDKQVGGEEEIKSID